MIGGGEYDDSNFDEPRDRVAESCERMGEPCSSCGRYVYPVDLETGKDEDGVGYTVPVWEHHSEDEKGYEVPLCRDCYDAEERAQGRDDASIKSERLHDNETQEG